MPFKSRRKNTRKKRKIRRKEKIRTGIACGLLITKKKNAKKNPLEDVQNKTPKKKKKKKTVFSRQNPLAEIYICTVDLSQSMEKKFTISTPPPMHFPKIMFTSCPTSLPKPRKKTDPHIPPLPSSQIAQTLETSISKLILVQGAKRMERGK
jgi:hypothetical protein